MGSPKNKGTVACQGWGNEEDPVKETEEQSLAKKKNIIYQIPR